ncbi:glycosyltransferase family 32 protein [Flagellimonas sp.]|uniref:glycosyltransferase family 32 protein n=1 Tax=Flagellimonas sp. TaxID=2058762 RepID=UPI003B5B8177
MIPKIIHFCWLSGEEYPESIRKNIEDWKIKMPDYEFILWDKEKYDLANSSWVKQAFESKKFAFASDLIRLYAVYTYGGIYLDTDVEVLKSFDDLLDLPYFIGSQHNNLIEAAIFGSEKKSDWILRCLQYYDNRAFIKDDGNFDMLVLPRVMKRQLEGVRKINIMEPHEIARVDTLLKNDSCLYLYPFDFFCSKNYESGKISKTKNTYTVHHFQSSWLPVFSKLRRRLIRFIGVSKTEKIITSMGLRRFHKVLTIPMVKSRLIK